MKTMKNWIFVVVVVCAGLSSTSGLEAMQLRLGPIRSSLGRKRADLMDEIDRERQKIKENGSFKNGYKFLSRLQLHSDGLLPIYDDYGDGSQEGTVVPYSDGDYWLYEFEFCKEIEVIIPVYINKKNAQLKYDNERGFNLYVESQANSN